MLPPFADQQLFHSGSWSGFRAHMTHQPEADVHLIVLSNNYDGETPLGFAAGTGHGRGPRTPGPKRQAAPDRRPLATVTPAGAAAPAAVEPNRPPGA
jgi:hypothetical protein